MFYFFEVIYRLSYLFLSILISCLILYFYKNYIITLLSVSLLSDVNFVKNLVYMHPMELFKSYLTLIIFFSTFFHIPTFFWHVSDFLKSGLSFKEYNYLSSFFFKSFLVFLFINLFSFFKILPVIWSFFNFFGLSLGNSELFQFSLELRLKDYLSFIGSFSYFINLIVVLFLILFLLTNLFGISNILYWKKLFIFFNIMFATFLSPPDVYSQISILVFLSFILEMFLFLSIFVLKLDKKHAFLVWHVIK